MKTIQWKIVIDNNKIATLENGVGFPTDDIESHLTIIGLLENIKQKHLEKLNTLYSKTVKKGEEDDGC